ncbi:MAG TPA: hypothetical protein EYP56_16045 [Planctomycetaceae bacterium]|nr:hypothetical protein [Planctomycetaceae bacterium]HIQ19919.1 hypothetical protein [Planctomycetota bacterium]
MTIRHTSGKGTEASAPQASGARGSLCQFSKTAAAVLLLGAAFGLLSSSCNQPAPGAEDGDFALGAFPPTLSDTEYHQRAWSRPTCLSCHDNELEDAPKILHTSLPPEAKQVKCRTCHVLVPGSPPR